MMNPMIQAPVITIFQSAVINTAGRGKAPPFTRYVKARSGTARGDPARHAPYFIVEVMGRRSRGDPAQSTLCFTNEVKIGADRVEKKRGDPGG